MITVRPDNFEVALQFPLIPVESDKGSQRDRISQAGHQQESK
jgi:hypothetical protein